MRHDDDKLYGSDYDREYEKRMKDFVSNLDIEDDEENDELYFRVEDVRIACLPHREVSEVRQLRRLYSPCEGSYIHVTFYLHNLRFRSEDWSSCFVLRLASPSSEIVEELNQYIEVSEDESTAKVTASFAYGEKNMLFEGEWAVQLYSKRGGRERFECQTEFSFVQLPAHYTDCFEYISFELYRGEKSCDELTEAKSQNSFNIEGLDSITMLYLAKNLLAKEWTPEFVIMLFDEVGRVIYQRRVVEALSPLDDKSSCVMLNVAIPDTSTRFWAPGFYTLKIMFREDVILSAPFEVGNQDQIGLFSREAIQPVRSAGQRKTVKAEGVKEPIEQLNAMIGLSSIKKKLHSFLDLTRLNNKRREAGLPINPLPLHAVFIGNPGTGKTTIAALIGRIFKDMGLLSKGHVVFEERSTLLGQYYSSEGEKTLNAINRAEGGILFIDEAYSLYKAGDPKDPGINVLETLMTALSDPDRTDWMLVLAGYPREMKAMLAANPGLESRLPESNRFYFDDYNVDELMQIADIYCGKYQYEFTPEARKALRSVVRRAHSIKDETFGNGRYIETLLTHEILPALSARVCSIESPTIEDLSLITLADVPAVEQGNYSESLNKLRNMVGLDELKKSIESHLNFVKLIALRREAGMHTEQPPLHMIFTGNPGTGKTTVADFIGEIYYSMGLLSRGNVIRVERADMVGAHIGETEEKMKKILKQAQGNVLFIDEAYNLFIGGENSKQDFGQRAIEALLTVLSREAVDMLVILAGYPKDMDEMLSSNSGLKSRFPYTFHFEDYSVEELLQIADLVVQRSGYHFTPEAREKLETLICREYRKKESHFGNGRFITRLISTRVIPAMSNRIASLPASEQCDAEILQTICAEDIPISDEEMTLIRNNGFDEQAIDQALAELDELVGLEKVKTAVHNFVEVSRYRNKKRQNLSDAPMKWSFVGNTGTGKSTVAGIMGRLLHAMHLLDKGQLIELKAEEIYNVPDYKVDEILRGAMERSQQGLLFIDGDAPQFKNPQSHFDSEKLRIKLTSYTAELPGSYALIIAEHESLRQPLVSGLSRHGVVEIDNTLLFEDYTADELFVILSQMLKKYYSLTIGDEAQAILRTYIDGICNNREMGYANARTMKIIARTIADIAQLRESRDGAEAVMGVVTADDVESFVWDAATNPRKVGF